jgi:N4-gp56 family major capsid protein
MALTNFAALTTEQKTVWSMDLWRQARNMSFVNRFLGKGPNSMVQHITELKKSEKGARAVITLLADLTGDGVAGDRALEGNEEAMNTYDNVIRIDQLRHANRHEGRMADQKSIVEFRGNSRDVLAYWLADRIDQLAFQTLGGITYDFTPGGKARTGSDLINLEFAADVSAPTTNRMLRVSGNGTTVSADNTIASLTSNDTLTWAAIIQMKAFAKDNYIRGVKDNGGEETYHLFVTPQMMAKLKKDPDWLAALRYALPREANNPLFTGATVKVDGIYIHEFRHVPNNSGMATKTGWGAGNNVNGGYALFCGAQALGMADIGNPEWVEKEFDYGNQQGISVSKILGFKKPKFWTQYQATPATEDFGVIRVAVAQ